MFYSNVGRLIFTYETDKIYNNPDDVVCNTTILTGAQGAA